jgi:beta-N-acetylhexosaminidase
MRTRLRKIVSILSLLVLLAGVGTPATAGQASSVFQTVDPAYKARLLLSKMTPEERVGQLFLITFQGTNADEKSQIYELITKNHVGGVVLSRKNNNFVDADGLLAGASTLISTLQKDESIGSQVTNEAISPTQYVPLLIGISQEGDLYPNDQILSGLTPLPNLMAIGATWDRNISERVGTVMGSELESLGINLILGPSLDVLDVLHTDSSSEDLGTRTFGGDPYWVGELGRAYITGLHKGSDGHLAVISTHFPGRGSSDRSPETEIATVRKTLEQLKQVELAPFFAATTPNNAPEAVTDGLLLSHIRYQGFQGNIRATTKPVSFDKDALTLILKLPQFSAWRDGGGIIVSDNLGSQAVRKFFDPAGNSFDARQVARNAFLAGNDMLYLDDFVATGDSDQTTTIQRTLDLFTQKYREDTNFAQLVDSSVERVLELKYRLYPEFTLTSVAPDPQKLSEIGKGQQVTFDTASEAVTLISPDATELVNVLPRPPEVRDRIVFITDVVNAKQCSNCAEKPTLAVDAMQSAVMKLYGPSAGGQVSRSLLTSYSFLDLWNYLMQQANVQTGAPATTPTVFDNDLKVADWVVFGVMEQSPDRPESQALRRLLTEHPELIRNKRVIVFAFNAPYILDATDISKLTAYYGLYGKSLPFAEVAARVLFQELTPSGSLPVSVPGVGYDLIQATSPDPNQVINLMLDLPDVLPATKTLTPIPTPVPTFKVGDTIPLRTGVILDHNRHAVPDGTPVRFLFTTGGESGVAQTIETVTQDGVARTSYRIEKPGLLEIKCTSDPALKSSSLQLDNTGNESAAVTEIVPTSLPSETATITPTLTPSPTATLVVTPVPQAQPGLGDWVLVLAISLGSGAIGLWLGIRLIHVRWGVRWGLCMVIGGLAAYNYLALKFPGTHELLKNGATSGTVLTVFFGVVLGGSIGLAWHWYETRRKSGDRPTI